MSTAYSGSRKNESVVPLARAMLGLPVEDEEAHMTKRERVDFGIVTLIFGVLVAGSVCQPPSP